MGFCCIISLIKSNLTRMITFIKAKLKKSGNQTNTDKYRVDANITEYYNISKLIFFRNIVPNFLLV